MKPRARVLGFVVGFWGLWGLRGSDLSILQLWTHIKTNSNSVRHYPHQICINYKLNNYKLKFINLINLNNH